MPLKASQTQVSDIVQPSTAYPTGAEGIRKILPSKPSDAGDRGHLKPVYLLPSSVRKRDSGTCAERDITDVWNASTVADRETPASGAVGYASSSDVDSRILLKPRKGCRVCRINEPAPPGHSCRLKQKERKKCRSSMSCPVRIIVA